MPIEFLGEELSSIPLNHPVRQFRDYWVSIKNEAGPVCRKDLSLREISKILPWVMILDIEEEASDFIYRLAGTEIVQMIGFEPTGSLLDDVLNEQHYAERKALYQRVANTLEPIYYASSVPVKNRTFQKVYSGVFPVTSERGPQLFLVTGPRDLGVT